MNYIAEDAKVSEGCRIGNGVSVASGVRIGKGVRIGNNATINENVEIGEGSFIGPNVVLGEYTANYYRDPDGYTNQKLKLGRSCVIRANTVLYAGSEFGDGFQTGHSAVIRERNKCGKSTLMGGMVQTENNVTVGDYSRVLSHTEIGKNAKIGNYVWIFAFAILTDDLHPPCGRCIQAATVEDYAIVGPHSILMPKVTIGKNAIVAPNTVVTKDVPEGMVVVGSPGRVIKKVSELKCKEGLVEQPYPWLANVPAEKRSRYGYDRK